MRLHDIKGRIVLSSWLARARNGRAAAWLREARGWTVIELIGGLIGLVAIILIYPSELSVPR
jgi:hypothetical protein